MSIQAPNIIIDCISHTRYMLYGVAGNNWNWAGPEENPQISIAASGCAEKTNHGLDVFSIHVFYHQLLSISSNQAYQCHNHYICIVFNHIALLAAKSSSICRHVGLSVGLLDGPTRVSVCSSSDKTVLVCVVKHVTI